MIGKNFFSKKPVGAFRYLALALAVLSVSPTLVSCGSDDDDLVGNWVVLSSMNGSRREYATGTTVTEADGKEYGYVGLGADSDGDRLVDFYKYDPLNGEYGDWKQIEDFPGVARTHAVSFSIDGTLYVGTGYTDVGGSIEGVDSIAYLNDFYKYDSASDNWTQIADMPTGEDGLRGCVAFALNGYGYVGLGQDGDNDYKEFYKYDPSTGDWEDATSFPGAKLSGAASFVIGNKAYVGAGVNNGTHQTGWYSFDGTDWIKQHSLITDDDDDYSKDDDYDYNIIRSYTATFVINGKGYFATAGQGSVGSTVWEYTPSDDSWEEKTEFEGSSRIGAVGLTINGMGYLTTGGASGLVFDDIWRLDPNVDQEDGDNYQ